MTNLQYKSDGFNDLNRDGKERNIHENISDCEHKIADFRRENKAAVTLLVKQKYLDQNHVKNITG